MINLSNVTELLDILTPEDCTRITSSNAAFIILNLHTNTSKGAFVSFTFSNDAAMYEPDAQRGILPLPEVKALIKEQQHNQALIKLHLHAKRIKAHTHILN